MTGLFVPTKKGSMFSFISSCSPNGVVFPVGEADWLSPLEDSGSPSCLCVCCEWTTGDPCCVTDGCIETTTERIAKLISDGNE